MQNKCDLNAFSKVDGWFSCGIPEVEPQPTSISKQRWTLCCHDFFDGYVTKM